MYDTILRVRCTHTVVSCPIVVTDRRYMRLRRREHFRTRQKATRKSTRAGLDPIWPGPDHTRRRRDLDRRAVVSNDGFYRSDFSCTDTWLFTAHSTFRCTYTGWRSVGFGRDLRILHNHNYYFVFSKRVRNQNENYVEKTRIENVKKIKKKIRKAHSANK